MARPLGPMNPLIVLHWIQTRGLVLCPTQRIERRPALRTARAPGTDGDARTSPRRVADARSETTQHPSHLARRAPLTDSFPLHKQTSRPTTPDDPHELHDPCDAMLATSGVSNAPTVSSIRRPAHAPNAPKASVPVDLADQCTRTASETNRGST